MNSNGAPAGEGAERGPLSSQDRETIRGLLFFLPFFERAGLEIGGARAEWESNVLQVYPAKYVDEVYAFFHLLAPPFIDALYIPKRVEQWLMNPNFLENASPEQIRTVLTWLCRGERFCDGFWEDQFKNGNLVRALRRLQSLQAADFRYDAAASARAEEEAISYRLPEPEVITMNVANADGTPLQAREPEHS